MVKESDVSQFLMDMEKINFVHKHHPYSISQGRDKRWRTYIKDPLNPTKRKQIVKISQDKIYDYLYKFYTNPSTVTRNITLSDLYPDWIKHKEVISTSNTNIIRVKSTWKKFYENSPIATVPLKDFTKISLEEWACSVIKSNELDSTAYSNFALIIRQMLDYAVDLSIIEENLFRAVNIPRRIFTKNKKKDGESQVYSEDEAKEIEEIALADFYHNHNRHKYPLAPLSVIFLFHTGLRLGEVCAIRYEDISDQKLHIQRMYQRDTKKIINHTKSDDGDRIIPLDNTAGKIIALAKEYQKENNAETDGYIFSIDTQPLSYNSVSVALKKFCRIADIPYRSCHSIRKTVISKLIDNGINIDTVRRFAGHADEKTTLVLKNMLGWLADSESSFLMKRKH